LLMKYLLLFLLLIATASSALAESETVVALSEPDESGRIPILMYHHISEKLDTIYNVPPDSFRKQLEQFYEAGFVLISLSSYYDDDFLVPAGRMPLILTFDDGHGNNFRFLDDGSIDPDCAIGVIEEFGREHPDFGHTATIFFNAGEHVIPFRVRSTAAEKLNWMFDNDYEVGNHTTDHVNLKNCDAYQVRRQVGLCQAALIKYAPRLEGEIRFFAYPYGATPQDQESFAALKSGSFNGTSWTMDLCMKAWEGPAPSPADATFWALRYAIPRIEMHTQRTTNGYGAADVINWGSLYISDGVTGSSAEE